MMIFNYKLLKKLSIYLKLLIIFLHSKFRIRIIYFIKIIYNVKLLIFIIFSNINYFLFIFFIE